MTRKLLGSFGPAKIVASVVLGPGSIVVSSKIGADFGYDLLWVVIAAATLMVGMTALSARLGVTLERTPCEELARTAGRPWAVLVGIVLFLVVACFQFSNNTAVLAVLAPFFGTNVIWQVVAIVTLNLAIGLALFGFDRLYRPTELLMKALVGLMVLGFLTNLFCARPSLSQTLGGMLPGPLELSEDSLFPVLALVGTTFSVAGAFYQAYLVRKKGWTLGEQRQGLIDTLLGISVLALLTMTVMITTASVLHDKVKGDELKSIADVAAQLEPLFGPWANALFSVGLLAGAFSSFLVNVMIGGTILSDGLGLGGDMDEDWPKRFTLLALFVGMAVAVFVVVNENQRPVYLITFAQAMTVLGTPVLAGALLWLSVRASTKTRTPRWMLILGWLGFLVSFGLAYRVGAIVYAKLTSP